MAIELVEPVKRVEHYLYALCVMDFNNIPIPRSRLEFFAHALITGVLPKFQAETREEVYMTAIITGDYANLPLPKSRADQLLYKICLGETEIRDIELETRYEMLLAYIAEHGDMSLETVLVECVNALQTIPNTVEVPVKSAILKGQTLVNLVKTSVYGGVQNGTCVDGDYPYKVIESIVGVGASILTRFQTIYPLSPSTVYYLKLTDVAHTNAFLVREHDNGKNLITQIHDLENKIIKFTTSELGTSDLFFYQQQLQVGAKVKYSENFIISDDVDSLYNVNDYFTGIQSVKMPVLTTTGKNIFGGELINGYINSSGNWNGSSGNIVCKDFISITPNDKVAISLYNESLTRVKATTYVRFYDINFNAIDSNIYFANSQDVIVTAPTNAKYLKFYYTGTTKLNVQIEQNSIITTYEPYKSNILTVNEDVELRGIGDVRDELDCLTGELTQRIGEIVLDGSESIFYDNGYERFYTELHTFKKETNYTSSLLSDKFKVVQNQGHVMGGDFVITGYGDSNGRYPNQNWLYFNINGITSVGDMKTYLSQNPVTVQYKLATESVKTVVLTITDQDGNAMPCLSTFNDATHVSINAVDIIPQVDLEVRVDANTMANVASQQENVVVAQASLSDAIDAQNDDIEMTKQALDEVKGE